MQQCNSVVGFNNNIIDFCVKFLYCYAFLQQRLDFRNDQNAQFFSILLFVLCITRPTGAEYIH